MESSVGNGGSTGTVSSLLLRKMSSRSELSVETLADSSSGECPTGVGSSLVLDGSVVGLEAGASPGGSRADILIDGSGGRGHTGRVESEGALVLGLSPVSEGGDTVINILVFSVPLSGHLDKVVEVPHPHPSLDGGLEHSSLGPDKVVEKGHHEFGIIGSQVDQLVLGRSGNCQ